MLARERYESYVGLELSQSTTLLLVGAGLAIPFGLTGAAIGLPAAAVVGALVGAVLLVREARRDQVVDSGDSMPRALRLACRPGAGTCSSKSITASTSSSSEASRPHMTSASTRSLLRSRASPGYCRRRFRPCFSREPPASRNPRASARSAPPEEDEARSREGCPARRFVRIRPAVLLVVLLLVIGVPLLYGPASRDDRCSG